MAFIHLGKKKEQKPSCCSSKIEVAVISKDEMSNNEGASIKILGSGCAKCNKLEAATKLALEQMGMQTDIEHVTDFSRIASYGVMTTPALVIDGRVVSYGKVLKSEEVVELLKEVKNNLHK